ncbi:malic enzyme-like NAD(P)-binding protein, partial [Oenococcus oeni]
VIDQQDVFIGLSDADVLSADQVKRMSSKPIVFALANPLPEINPEIAQTAGAQVIATGSAQYLNQVNNVLVFPGLYKGLLTYGIKQVDYK